MVFYLAVEPPNYVSDIFGPYHRIQDAMKWFRSIVKH